MGVFSKLCQFARSERITLKEGLTNGTKEGKSRL